MSPISRVSYLCIVLYIVASLFHTTGSVVSYLVGVPLNGIMNVGFPSEAPLWVAKDSWDRPVGRVDAPTPKPGSPKPAPHLESPGDSNLLAMNLWQHNNLADTTGTLGVDGMLSMEAGLVLSKAFATSMKPTKIIPYFYRASGPFESEDVTVTSLITADRLHVFAGLVARYQGAMRDYPVAALMLTPSKALFQSLFISKTQHVKSLEFWKGCARSINHPS